MKIWHYHTAGGNATFQEDQLNGLIAGGTITPQTLVWCDGMPAWAAAGGVFAQAFSSGSQVSAPPPLPGAVSNSGKRSHEIDYQIIGESIQMVEIELDPNETVIAEAGAMNYMEDGITFETKMGDGSSPDTGLMGKLMAVGKRALAGESVFMTHFTNRGAGKKHVTFAAPYPGTVVPVDLSTVNGELFCEKDAFLCAALGTSVGIAFNRKLGAGFFGGEGFILQHLKGDGLAFVHAGGTVIRKELKGEKLMVDTGCLVAFTSGINYDIQRAGNMKSMIFGGEGLFLTTLQGHGTVWLQSMPFSRLAQRITGMYAAGKGEGSVLGGLGNLFGD